MPSVLASIPYHTFPSFSVGPLTIRTFGVFVALGILIGTWLFLRYARDKGLDTEELTGLAWRLVIFGIVGSRVLFVLTHLSDFRDRPLKVFALWEGGLEFSGAVLISVIVILWWARRHPGVPTLLLVDGIVYGLVPGIMIGRIGCYAVGEHLGGPTSFFLGVRYEGGVTREGPIPLGTTIHNTALYEILLLVPLFLLMVLLKRRGVRDGWLTVTFLVGYGVQRFLTDFLRAYDRTVYGLTGAQFLSIAMVTTGLVIAVRLRRRYRGGSPTPEPSPEPTGT